MDEHLRPLRLLLLPEPLERFALQADVERLRRTGDVAVVDPPRISYGALAKLPVGVAQGMAGRVARRLVRTLRRDGARPVALVIFDPVQVLHARALLHLVPECALWYGRREPPGDDEVGPHYAERLRLLDAAGERIADRTFVVRPGFAEVLEDRGVERWDAPASPTPASRDD